MCLDMLNCHMFRSPRTSWHSIVILKQKIIMNNLAAHVCILALRTQETAHSISRTIDPRVVVTALRFPYDKDFYLLTSPHNAISANRQE